LKTYTAVNETVHQWLNKQFIKEVTAAVSVIPGFPVKWQSKFRTLQCLFHDLFY